MLVLDLVAEHMPHFPVDESFRTELPAELVPYLERWEVRRSG